MKWFKHDSDASIDAKVKLLIMTYGLEGYGLYWYCLELVARDVSANNLTFELEHDSQIIAKDFDISPQKVSEIMNYMVEINLFENADGIITCLKMAARTDEYTQKLIKTHTQLIGTLSGHNPTKSVLIEQKRREEKLHPHFAEFWTYYPKKKDKQQALKAWNKQKPDIVAVKKALIHQKKSEEWTKQNGQFVPYPSTYINRRRWEDELSVKTIVEMRTEN
jgi:hypothetical protein